MASVGSRPPRRRQPTEHLEAGAARPRRVHGPHHAPNLRATRHRPSRLRPMARRRARSALGRRSCGTPGDIQGASRGCWLGGSSRGHLQPIWRARQHRPLGISPGHGRSPRRRDQGDDRRPPGVAAADRHEGTARTGGRARARMEAARGRSVSGRGRGEHRAQARREPRCALQPVRAARLGCSCVAANRRRCPDRTPALREVVRWH